MLPLLTKYKNGVLEEEKRKHKRIEEVTCDPEGADKQEPMENGPFGWPHGTVSAKGPNREHNQNECIEILEVPKNDVIVERGRIVLASLEFRYRPVNIQSNGIISRQQADKDN